MNFKMNTISNYREDGGYVNIHGQDVTVCICEKTGSILVPIDEVSRMGFRLYKKSQYSKLLVEDSQFNEEFQRYMLQSAQTYMLENKIAFKENDVLEAINKCKAMLNGVQIHTDKSKAFVQNHTVEQSFNGDISITASISPVKTSPPKLREPHHTAQQIIQNERRIRMTDDNKSESSVEGDTGSKTQYNKRQNHEVCERLPSVELDMPEHLVYVSFHEDANYYWIQKIENVKVLADISQEILSFLPKSKPTSRTLFNKIYLASFEDEWFRCRIIKFRPLKVFFVDYGNTAENVTDLREVNEKLSSIQAQAVKIKLKSNLTLEVGGEFKIKLEKKFDKGTYEASLVENKQFQPSPKVNLNPPPKVVETIPTFFHKSKSPPVEEGTRLMVIAHNNGKLVVRNKELYAKFKEITRVLSDNPKLKPVNNVEIDQIVIIKRDNKLERAVVTNKEKHSITVNLLDEFLEERVELSELYHIDESLAKEPPSYMISPPILNYTSSKEDVLDKLISSNNKGTAVVSDRGFDLQIESGLLSNLFANSRFTIDDIECLKPEMGLGSYTFLAVNDKTAIYFCPKGQIEENLNVILKSQVNSDPYKPVIGEVCHGHYEDQWYRCVVLRIMDSEYEVRFIDFGNIEVVLQEDLRQLTDDAKSLPALAFQCKLIGVPSLKVTDDKLKKHLIQMENYDIMVKGCKNNIYEIEIPSLFTK